MIETVVIAARIAQFLAAMVLFGTPLFYLYAVRARQVASLRWPRPLLAACSVGLVLGAVASLLAQTAAMAGDAAAAMDPDTLRSVVTESAFGTAILVRLAASIAALIATVMRPGIRLWSSLALLGAVALASFAWSGHGAADDGAAGWIHAAADVLHLLAAGTWSGALVALATMVSTPRRGGELGAAEPLHHALKAFSGIGTGVVAAIVASGLINSWFLVGLPNIWRMAASPYGRLLLVKLGLFVAMLGLAALNRYRLTPNLETGLGTSDPSPVLAALRRSLLLETGAAAAILVLVSVLGTLEPVSAQ